MALGDALSIAAVLPAASPLFRDVSDPSIDSPL